MNNLRNTETLLGHNGVVWCVRFSHSGKLLASCSQDKSIRIWKYNELKHNWECIEKFENFHKRSVRYLCWSPCDGYLASAGFDSLIGIWQLKNGEPTELIQELDLHQFEVKSVAWINSGEYLASCSRDKSVLIYDVGEDFEIMESPADIHDEDVKCVSWHPNERILVSCGYDNRICVINQQLDEWCQAAVLSDHEQIVRRVEFNSKGDILASCSDDLSIKLWKPKSGDFTSWLCVKTITGYHSYTIWDIRWLPSDHDQDNVDQMSCDLLISCSMDNQICVYNVVTKTTASSLVDLLCVDLLANQRQAHTEDINSIDITRSTVDGSSSHDAIIVSGSDDFSIKMWSLSISDDDFALD